MAAPASTQADHNGTGRAATLSWLSTIRARLYIALGFMAATTGVCSLIALYAFTKIGGTPTENVLQNMPAAEHYPRLPQGTGGPVAATPQPRTVRGAAGRSPDARAI